MDTPLFRFDRFPDVRVLEHGQLRRITPGQWAQQAAARAEFFSRELPQAREVALIGQTSTNLLLSWLGLLMAGKTPCLLQYPTAKLSWNFWESSIRASLADCGLSAAVVDETVHSPRDLGVMTIPLPHELPPASTSWPEPAQGEIIQLSSGTTGVRKGIRFPLSALRRHALGYGAHLGLGPQEVMVSWLPLYHDMGFITSWIMPLAAGFATVLMDPMDWVREPGVFFDLVAGHGGTRCYLPNFALEVLSRHYQGQDLTTLKEVVSCSEPTRAATLARFAQATGLPPERLSNCYAMAENVFAVSHARNPRTFALGEGEYVGCGRPVPGVEVKVTDGELFVRSAYSMTRYVNGQSVADGEGFYATGDMGLVLDGEVVVQGRRGDVVIVGGEKHFLSDVDHAVSMEVPSSKGRACAFVEDDRLLGTEAVRVLIEHERFWTRGAEADALASALAERTGLAALGVDFAPPGFITKTSSGKVNRRITARHHALARQGRAFEAGGLSAGGLLEMFPQFAKGGPVGRLLDSLAFLTLTLVLAEHGLSCGPDEQAHALLERLDRQEHAEDRGEVLLIVSLTCSREDSFFTSAYLDSLSQTLGVPIHYERLIVPRADVLLRDLIFHDWFLPRASDERHGPFRAVVSRLKQAGVILFGQTTELIHPRFLTYPVLAHDFRHDPGADTLAMRWPGYFRNHHLLEHTASGPRDFEPNKVNEHIASLASYLDAEPFRLAFIRDCSEHTRAWEYQEQLDYDQYMQVSLDPARDQSALQAAFTACLRARTRLKLSKGLRRNRLFRHGAHYCGWLVDKVLLDKAETFCQPHQVIGVAGPECSLPGLSQRLREQGKRLVYLTDNADDESDYDVFLQTGYDESLRKNKPSLLLMDSPLARLARYTCSPFPLPASQLKEYLDARPAAKDLSLAQAMLDGHFAGLREPAQALRLVAARELPAGTVLKAGDLAEATGSSGVPAGCAGAIVGRVLQRPRQAGAPIELADIVKG